MWLDYENGLGKSWYNSIYCSCSSTDRMEVCGTSDGSSILPGSTRGRSEMVSYGSPKPLFSVQLGAPLPEFI